MSGGDAAALVALEEGWQAACDAARWARLPGGARLRYVWRPGAGGEGRRPLLLLRPVGGTMRLWGAFGAQLARTRPVLAFDPRGVGASSAARWFETTEAMAGDALALLDAVGRREPVDVFGLSLGGMVAMSLALEAPARVRRLVLASTTARGLSPRWGSARRGAALAACLTRSGAATEACLIRRMLSPATRQAAPARVEALEAAAQQWPTRRRELIKLLAAAVRHDARDRLGAV